MDGQVVKARTALRELFLQLGQADVGTVFGDELLNVSTATPIALRTGDIQHRGFRGHLGPGRLKVSATSHRSDQLNGFCRDIEQEIALDGGEVLAVLGAY